jgi:hypothetical protein
MEKALAKIDFNIKMFESYRPDAHVTATLERLRSDRAALVAYANNERTRESLPYSAREWLWEMPAWGTYGT